MRDCPLCFGDEVCSYHRGNEFNDRIPKVGLPILKVRPVESRQPRTVYFAKTLGRSPFCKQTLRDCLVVFHLSADTAITLALPDIGPLIVLLFSLAYGKLQLYESPLNIQTNGDQSQALFSRFSDERADF